MIVNFRVQYPVGQGCFHAANLMFAPWGPERLGFLYVYDCGALWTYTAARKREIERFHAETERQRIDILFLSHLHYDHVSGVAQLCQPKGDPKKPAGSPVDTIVMPLVDVIDRVISFARSAAEEPDALDDFARALALDPVAAVAGLDPRQIILIVPGEGPAPESAEAGFPEEPGPGEPSGISETEAKIPTWTWRLTADRASAAVSKRWMSSTGDLPGPQVFEIDDTRGFIVQAPGSAEAWLLAPYVDAGIEEHRADFLAAGAKVFQLTSDEFQEGLNNTETLRGWLATRAPDLAKAYKAAGDLNVMSLCLFSGPFTALGPGAHWHAEWGRGWANTHYFAVEDPPRLGWLGTGDAVLTADGGLGPFIDHYRAHLPLVSNLLAPHHGAAGNFENALLDQVNPDLVSVSADTFKNWHHPATELVLAVASRGLSLSVITSDRRSELHEFAETRRP